MSCHPFRLLLFSKFINEAYHNMNNHPLSIYIESLMIGIHAGLLLMIAYSLDKAPTGLKVPLTCLVPKTFELSD